MYWGLNAASGNDTASDGTSSTAGFDGITAETAITGQVNGATDLGIIMPSAIPNTAKTGLSEGEHYITVLGKQINGGTTVTWYKLYTFLQATVQQ